MQVIDLNHVALPVRDLSVSIDFYHRQLGLPMMNRPDFDFEGAWLKIGTIQELHLISRDQVANNQAPRDHHFALQVQSIIDAEKRLIEEGIKYEEKKKRPDGSWQIFLQDPDGYFIELCELT